MGKMTIITLDAGHCETTAARPVFVNGKFEKIENLYLNQSKDKAIATEVLYRGQRFNYFKAAPKHFDDMIQGEGFEVERRELIKRYFQTVFENIVNYNTEISRKDKILLVVGCPTSKEWTSKENKQEYEKLIREATGAEQVCVVAESRAAMFSALADGKGRMISAVSGAAVYDFGSSTLDFTYMKTGEQCIEYSWTLGARAIEKALRKMMCREAARWADERGQELVPIKNYADLEKILRKAKEAYFSGELNDNTNMFIYKFETSEGKKLPVILSLDADTIEEALKEELSLETEKELIIKSWKNGCKEFFEKSKQMMKEKNCQVKEIILTGGASRMKFVQEYAAEVFPKEESYIITCAQNPSFSVSQGLVWVALVDELEKETVSGVTEQVCQLSVSRVWGLKQNLKSGLGEIICQAVSSSAQEWAQASADESLNDLQNRMEKSLKSRNPEIRKMQERVLESWSNDMIAKIRESLMAEIQESLGSAFVQKIQIPENKWKVLGKEFDSIHINIDKMIDELDMNSLWRNLLKWIYIVLYAAAGMVIFPVVVTLIGAIISGIIGECFNDTDREKSRNSKERKRASKKFANGACKNEILQLCDKQIDAIIGKHQLTDEAVKKDIEQIVKQAYEMMTLKSIL